jgi:hypothetical protein
MHRSNHELAPPPFSIEPTMSDASPKREYRRPELKVYGEMKVVTQSNSSINMNDKGNGSFSMT